MTRSTAIDPSKPHEFFLAGWRVARRAPVVFIARALFDLAANAIRFGAIVVVALALAAHLGIHLDQGGTPFGWLDSLLATVARPGAAIGIAGMAFTAWLTLLVLESITSGGIWTVLAKRLRGEKTRPATLFFAGAMVRFPDALKQRIFAAFVDLMLVGVTVGTIAGTVPIARLVSAAAGSDLVAPALVWAAVLTVFGVCAGLVRLTTEMVAAPMFVEDVGLGEGLLRAGALVAGAPLRIYRLFVLAAGVLIPPLLLYWAAIMFQNLTIEIPELSAVAGLTRLGAELVMLCAVAAFAVMLHAAFFAYYSWAVDRLDPDVLAPSGETAADRPPGLEHFLPDSHQHVISVEEVVGPWPEDQVMEPSKPMPDLQTSTTVGAEEFSLDGILRSTDRAGDEEE